MGIPPTRNFMGKMPMPLAKGKLPTALRGNGAPLAGDASLKTINGRQFSVEEILDSSVSHNSADFPRDFTAGWDAPIVVPAA